MTEPTHISTTQMRVSEYGARYEVLRRHALERHDAPAARDGLAVLLRQGVAAWMDAWSRVPAPPPRATGNRGSMAVLPDSTSAEVVRVLAAMALGHIQEVHA
jgi:hypothetical protein